ncbi:MAG: heat shock protein HslJ [Limisphaerales bacterium]
MNLAPVVLKFHLAALTCRTACLLALALAASALGQEASKIHSFKAAPVSLQFSSSDGDYHLVQSSRDLQKWVTVGQYPGNGKPAKFNDLRGRLGDVHFYRVATEPEPFSDALLGRKWRLVAFHEADEITRPKAGRTYTVTLSRKGKVSGRNDCNSYSGIFSLVKGNWLKFGKQFMSTRMLCSSGSLDFKFFESLHASKGFEVDGDKLKLYYGDNAEHWMEFTEND